MSSECRVGKFWKSGDNWKLAIVSRDFKKSESWDEEKKKLIENIHQDPTSEEIVESIVFENIAKRPKIGFMKKLEEEFDLDNVVLGGEPIPGFNLQERKEVQKIV